MNFNSFNRFFIFSLVVATAVYFFGVESSQYDSNFKSITALQSSGAIELYSIHEPSSPHPVGIEGKEEQVSTDEEIFDSNDAAGVAEEVNFLDKDLSLLSEVNEVIICSPRNFHCPLYIRNLSIII